MIWRRIPGTPYEASSNGDIRRMCVSQGSDGRIKKPTRNHNGYLGISIYANGKCIRTCVHTLVCIAFHGPRPKDHVISHKNHDKTDNRAENLEWVTPKENTAASIKSGRFGNGQRHYAYRTDITTEKVKEIMAIVPSQKYAAEKLKCSQSLISALLNNKRFSTYSLSCENRK